MKTTWYLFIALAILTSCNSEGNKTKSGETEKAGIIEQTYTVPQLIEVAADHLDDTIKVTGIVTHVCSHSGRRCFLEDSTGKHSIKVEAAGEIKGFNRELMGMQVSVIGTIQEKRLSNEYINDWELKVKEKGTKEAENGGESCASELSNIQSMRDWMKSNNKDYYSIYYINGLSYEIMY